MSCYVYHESEPSLWTVGFYDAHGKWVSESDHDSREGAARRVHYLNGGTDTALIDALRACLARFDEIDLAAPAGRTAKALLASVTP